MKEMNTLKIRIKFASSEISPVQPEPAYQYNWLRIISFSLVVITIVSLIISNIGNERNLETSKDINKQFTTLPTKQVSPAKMIDNVTAISPSIQNKIEDTSLSSNASSSVPTELAQVTLPNHQNHTYDNELASNLQVNIQESIEDNKLNKNDQPLLNDAKHEIFSGSKVRILSSQIKRFMIAKAVKNKEPIGTINDIKFDHNKIATIYAYSDATDLSNETLYYQWSFNGKTVAKVKVKVRGDRWRSYSTKFIPENKHGHWQVALQNQKGDNLAIQSFVY